MKRLLLPLFCLACAYLPTSVSAQTTTDAAKADGKAFGRDQAAAAPYAKGSAVTLPSDMDAKSTFIVRTELTVPHTILLMAPGLTSQLNKIDLGKTSYFRQRVGKKIDCSDC